MFIVAQRVSATVHKKTNASFTNIKLLGVSGFEDFTIFNLFLIMIFLFSFCFCETNIVHFSLIVSIATYMYTFAGVPQNVERQSIVLRDY